MKGICFKEPLFHATIESRKTQTRRIMHPQPNGRFSGTNSFDVYAHTSPDGNTTAVKPRYKVGDVVYLKEPYNDEASQYRTLYKFDNDVENAGKGFWKNKLFMPYETARHFIRITAVRAERLQEISDEDCYREGIFFVKNSDGYFSNGYNDDYTRTRDAYAALIDKINGLGTWGGNPWVWVYDYELHSIEVLLSGIKL